LPWCSTTPDVTDVPSRSSVTEPSSSRATNGVASGSRTTLTDGGDVVDVHGSGLLGGSGSGARPPYLAARGAIPNGTAGRQTRSVRRVKASLRSVIPYGVGTRAAGSIGRLGDIVQATRQQVPVTRLGPL
jgi:hypothetical protein